MFKALIAIAATISCAAVAHAHGGGQDTNGCHNDKKVGNYHCHTGPLAGQSFSSKAEAMKALDKAKPAEQDMLKPK